MQFGLFMMPLHPPERSFVESYDRDLAQIVAADRLGYHEVWIGEHLTERWENAPAPELLIAQALVMTEKIILATGVTLLALHNPVELAHPLPCSTIWRAGVFIGALVGAPFRRIWRFLALTRADRQRSGRAPRRRWMSFSNSGPRKASLVIVVSFLTCPRRG